MFVNSRLNGVGDEETYVDGPDLGLDSDGDIRLDSPSGDGDNGSNQAARAHLAQSLGTDSDDDLIAVEDVATSIKSTTNHTEEPSSGEDADLVVEKLGENRSGWSNKKTPKASDGEATVTVEGEKKKSIKKKTRQPGTGKRGDGRLEVNTKKFENGRGNKGKPRRDGDQRAQGSGVGAGAVPLGADYDHDDVDSRKDLTSNKGRYGEPKGSSVTHTSLASSAGSTEQKGDGSQENLTENQRRELHEKASDILNRQMIRLACCCLCLGAEELSQMFCVSWLDCSGPDPEARLSKKAVVGCSDTCNAARFAENISSVSSKPTVTFVEVTAALTPDEKILVHRQSSHAAVVVLLRGTLNGEKDSLPETGCHPDSLALMCRDLGAGTKPFQPLMCAAGTASGIIPLLCIGECFVKAASRSSGERCLTLELVLNLLGCSLECCQVIDANGKKIDGFDRAVNGELIPPARVSMS